MKKIIISFMLISTVLFAQENQLIETLPDEGVQTETSSADTTNSTNSTNTDGTTQVKRIYEYRPQTLIDIDNAIATSGNSGNMALFNSKYEAALNDYLEQIGYNSEKIFYIGNEYFLMNDYAKANKLFLKDNTDIKNVFGAATTYRFMGYNEKAVEKYSQAISMNSNFAESYLGRALANRNMDNYDSAINDLKKYISMTSRQEGYVALADIYFKIGKLQEVQSIANSGLAKYPNSQILKRILVNISKNK